MVNGLLQHRDRSACRGFDSVKFDGSDIDERRGRGQTVQLDKASVTSTLSFSPGYCRTRRSSQTQGVAMSEASHEYLVPEGDDTPRSWLRDADYRAFFYSYPVASVIGAPDGRILAANAAACQLFGRSEVDLCALGRPPIQDPNDLRWAAAVAERELTGQVRANLAIQTKDREVIETEVTSKVYMNEDGVERSLVTLVEAPRTRSTWRRSVDGTPVYGYLTEAELRVLKLLPTHYSQIQIAAMLFVSPNTIKTHFASLYRKLGVHDRTSAVERGRALGLL
jgi:PAS domain S-box-containing protein